MATVSSTTPSNTTRPFRFATWGNLGLTVVTGLVLGILQNRAYNLHHHDALLPNLAPYAVGAVLAGGIAALVLLRAHRSGGPGAGLGGAIGTAVLGIVAFPVTYYLSLAFVWGVTSWLLSRDAEPGRLATTARWVGIVALALTPIVVVLRLVGVTYQVGA